MSGTVVAERTGEPRSRAKIAGLFYLLTFATGMFAFLIHSRLGMAAGLFAAGCYVVVTILFYFVFAPVNRLLSLLAAAVSLIACAIGPLIQGHLLSQNINPLVFFGVYCLLIGYLIIRSTFLPRILGTGMIFAGMGWLTFFSPQVTSSLSPYNLIPGTLGEGSLTLWLLVKGLDEQRWREQFTARRELP